MAFVIFKLCQTEFSVKSFSLDDHMNLSHVK